MNNTISEKEIQILAVFGRVIPMLSDGEKERLLAFGEGMVFKAEEQLKEKAACPDDSTPPTPERR